MHSQRRILYIRTAKQVNTWSMQSTSGVLQRAGPSSFKRWQTTSSSSVVWESPQKPWRSKTYSWEGARGKNVLSWSIIYSLTIYSGTGAFELATLHVACHLFLIAGCISWVVWPDCQVVPEPFSPWQKGMWACTGQQSQGGYIIYVSWGIRWWRSNSTPSTRARKRVQEEGSRSSQNCSFAVTYIPFSMQGDDEKVFASAYQGYAILMSF